MRQHFVKLLLPVNYIAAGPGREASVGSLLSDVLNVFYNVAFFTFISVITVNKIIRLLTRDSLCRIRDDK